MIPILIVFALIGWFEAYSLSAKKKDRKKKLAAVISFIAVCAIVAETIYLLRNSFQIVTLIQFILGPLEHAITGTVK